MADFKLSDTIACYPVNLTRLKTWFGTSRGSTLLLRFLAFDRDIWPRGEKRRYRGTRTLCPSREDTSSTIDFKPLVKHKSNPSKTSIVFLSFTFYCVNYAKNLSLVWILKLMDGWRLPKFFQRKNIIVFFVCYKWTRYIDSLLIATQEIILDFFINK